ncbi:MAG: PQQ-dependent sugar dehydrogenase [Bacteroidota bacterium]|nr:PQQ-dependent sugar dehydrogenase [Bacteroidota bacterium]
MKKPIYFLLLFIALKASAQSETFSKRTVISGLNAAWEVVYGPNDSLWVTENKAYLISRINIANGVKTTLVDLRATDPSINFTSASGTQPQGGLMGLALHPNLYSSDPLVRAAKPWVYAVYVYLRNSCPGTNTSCVFTTKIVRFTYSGNTLSSPVIVLDNIPGSSDHNSGRLIIGPTIEPGSDAAHTQYRLYYTVGDMGAGQFLNTTRTENAQNVDVMEGKVLRINTESDGDAGLDAWVPNDNPFYTSGSVTPRDYVYSLGHRNPQGLVWGTAGGVNRLFSSEQQDRSDDEINVIVPGKNYGWDKVTGVCDGNVNGFKIGQTTSANEQAFCTVPANNYVDPIFATFTETAANMAALFAQTDNSLWPTIASSSIDFYSQTKIPGWHESILVSPLKQDGVYRLLPNSSATGVVTLPNGTDTITYFHGDGNRIRRIRIAPDGLRFYVARDAGTIMEYTYTGITLPSHFLSFDGKLISSGVAELTWEAVTDEQHDHFEVERSSDGNTFISLGKTVAAPPYKFIDASVQAGNNFYRVKQVNKDGKAIYSNEIKIVYDPAKAVVTTYPNPVPDYLDIKISAVKRTQVSITLTGIEGKVMYKKTSFFDPGTNDLKIDMQKMSSQVYILNILDNTNKEVLLTQKLLKLQ